MPLQCKGPVEFRNPTGSIQDRGRLDVARPATAALKLSQKSKRTHYRFGTFNGPRTASDEQVKAYIGYAHVLLNRRLWNRSEFHIFDDIQQELSIRSWVAIETFDPERGCSLHTWVVKLMLWERAESYRIYLGEDRVYLGIDRSPYIWDHFANVAEPPKADPEDLFAKLNIVSELIETIRKPRHKKAVIEHWFGGKTIQAIADEQNVTKQRISQMIQVALLEMRKAASVLSDDEKRAVGILGVKF